MQSDKRDWNPSLDMSYRVVGLPFSLASQLPFISEQRRRQILLKLVYQLELYRVEVPM